MPHFEVLSRRRVYDGFAKIDELAIRTEKNPHQQRLVIDPGEAAGILLHDTHRDKLLLVRQLRVAIDKYGDPWPLEIVAGKIDEGESAADAALREVEEEVGHRLESLERIATVFPTPGIFAERITLFYGQISEQTSVSGGGGDETEELELVDMSPDEAFELLDLGNIHDGKTIISLQWLRLRRQAHGS